jgi:hypothetical protein
MVNVGDKILTRGLFGLTSAAVSAGSDIMSRMGSNGTKSGSAGVGDNILTRGIFGHKSSGATYPLPGTIAFYCGFGGGDEVIYTIWYGYNTDGSAGSDDAYFIIEKRDPITLAIKSTTTVKMMDGSGIPTEEHEIFPGRLGSHGYTTWDTQMIGGTDHYLFVIYQDWSGNGVFDGLVHIRIYDSYDEYRYIGDALIPVYRTDTGTLDVNGLDGNVFTSPGADYDVEKWAILPLPSARINGTDVPVGSYNHGNASKIYEFDYPTIIQTNFPELTNPVNSDAYDGSPIMLDTTIGYSKLIPSAFGSDICTGWRWNITTMDKTAL